jgi:copper chaperone
MMIMQEIIAVENIKCGGCARTIENNLNKIPNIQSVVIDVEAGTVAVAGENLQRDELVKTLLSLGYPEKGSVSGISSFKAKATSVVSCAIGRIDKATH